MSDLMIELECPAYVGYCRFFNNEMGFNVISLLCVQ